jgi:RimJ/RimL family protein N-acetyltransferase
VHDERAHGIRIRPWAGGDLMLLQRLLGDPAMTEHIGGPETPKQLLDRHQRYCTDRSAAAGKSFAIIEDAVGAHADAGIGWVGYWETEWLAEQVWEIGWSILPEHQGRGVATQATHLVLALARAEGTHRFAHAFPSVHNGPSNSVCRKAGFTLLGEADIEYPKGVPMRANDWRIDLFEGRPA